MIELDLFGEKIDTPYPFPSFVRKKRKEPRPNGYARHPGTGPKGETCASCDHAVSKQLSRKRVYKCACSYFRWTHGRASDIVLKSPACILWTAKWKQIFNRRRGRRVPSAFIDLI